MQADLLAPHYSWLLEFFRDCFTTSTSKCITPIIVPNTQGYFALGIVDVDMCPRGNCMVPYPMHVIFELSCLANITHWVSMQLIADEFRIATRSIHKLELAHFWTIICAVNTIERVPIFGGHIFSVKPFLLLNIFEVLFILTVPPGFPVCRFKYAVSIAVTETSLVATSGDSNITEFVMRLAQTGEIPVDRSFF